MAFLSDIDPSDLIDDMPLVSRVKRIPGDYNMEIPAVIHNIFLYSTAKDVVKMSRVSKTFHEVASSDYLWREIVGDLDKYISGSKISKYVFFYDVKKEREDLFPKMQKKFQGSYKRAVRVKRKKFHDDLEELEREIKVYVPPITVFGVLLGMNAIFPPCGIILHAITIMGWGFVFMEDADVSLLVGSSACDALNLLCCYVCGWHNALCCIHNCLSCCCCCGLCYLFGVGFLYLPFQFLEACCCAYWCNLLFTVSSMFYRFFILDKDDHSEDTYATYFLLASPTILCIMALIVFGGATLVLLLIAVAFAVAICCIAVFGCCQFLINDD